MTDEITKAWSGMTTKQYKQHKGLKKEGLRDNMTNLELVLNMLADNNCGGRSLRIYWAKCADRLKFNQTIENRIK